MVNNIKILELISDSRIYNVYILGSYLYSSNNSKSDVDYLMITSDDFGKNRETIKYDNNIDVAFYSNSTWIDLCQNADIRSLEVKYIPSDFIIKETKKYEISSDIIDIRKSISAVVSNSWVKGKKKLTVPESLDLYIGKKSIWHCFRILMFGIQIYKYGRINNYSEANYLYEEIVNSEHNDWDYFKEKYQEPLNQLKSEFKKYSEKEWQKHKKEEIKKY